MLMKNKMREMKMEDKGDDDEKRKNDGDDAENESNGSEV